MSTKEQRYGAYLGILIAILIAAAMLLLSGCSAMTLKTHRVEADGSVVDVQLKSKREYAYFKFRYNPETKQLEIDATEVKTGPNEWAPVMSKLVDKIPDGPN